MKEDLQTKFDNFEGPYDFSGTEWQGLEERLNKRDLVPLGLLSLLAGLLLLGLLGSSIMLWRQNTALNQRLALIETAKSMTEKAAPVTILGQTDTIIKRTVIYQYDTIYRKITVVETKYLTPQYQQSTPPITTFYTTETTDKAAQGRSNASTRITTNSTTVPTTNLDNNHTTIRNNKDDKTSNAALPTSVREPQQSDNADKTEKKSGQAPPQYPSEKMAKNVDNTGEIKKEQAFLMTTDSLNEKESNAQKPLESVVSTTDSASIVAAKKPFTKDSITMKKIPFDSLDIVKKADNENKTGKKHPKYAFKMLPIYVGGVLGLPIWSKPSVIGQSGNQYGLKVEAVATERVRFFAEMNYSKNGNSKSTDIDMLPNEIAKPITEPGLTFKYWETDGIKSLNYILGIQYQIGKHEVIHPYVAAGFNGTTNFPFEVDFEYIDKVTSVEKKYVQQVSRLGHLNRVYGAIGVHWNAFPNGQLAAETYFTTPVNGDKSVTPTQIGIKIGAFYFIR